MLLIDDDIGEILEMRVLRYESMRPDYDGELS